MAIDNNNIIDFIGIDKISNEVILTITDHLNWTLKMDHLLKLQAKINKYIDFVESGKIYEDYEDSINRKIAIEVRYMYDLPNDEEIFVFCKKVEQLLNEININIRFIKF